jgi:hypothetical protein
MTDIERWCLDYNHIRPHSAHGGLTPEAVRLNPAAGRLRNSISPAARPLPPALQISYQTSDSHNDRRTGGGQVMRSLTISAVGNDSVALAPVHPSTNLLASTIRTS